MRQLIEDSEQPLGSANVGIAEIDHVAPPLDTTDNLRAAAPPSLAGSLVAGVFSVGGALAVERAAGFLANLLAARLAGATVFGAYSISLNTANNVASYAGAGIGNTATRFIADYPAGTRGRQQVVRTVLLFAALSAALAALLLWITARPLAESVLRNPALSGPLKVAAISAAAFVALECCRGVFIGTREFAPFLFLSALVGVGSLVAIPAMARSGATHMVAAQAGAVLLATLVGALLIFKRQGIKQKSTGEKADRVSLGKVWRFGLVQLGGVVGLNAAGWWTATLVARGDSSLLQIAFYTVATQWRNLCGLLPSMVPQGNFAFFTDNGSAHFGGATRVVSVSAIFASVLGFICSGFVIIPIPFVLRHFYGQSYAAAELPAAFAVATVIVHMGISPASSRLTVISLRWTAIVNAIWSVVVIIAGTLLIPHGGATAATATLFGAHVLSVVLVLFALRRLNALPEGLTTIAALNIALALVIGALAWLRAMHPEHSLLANSLLLVSPLLGTLLLVRLGQSCGALPRVIDWFSIARSVLDRVPFKSLRALSRAA
jgi:O-antigen/teichoic acid export membrane protein